LVFSFLHLFCVLLSLCADVVLDLVIYINLGLLPVFVVVFFGFDFVFSALDWLGKSSLK